MDIKVKGLLTAERLREVLALVEAGAGINCYFEGRLRLQATGKVVGCSTDTSDTDLDDVEDVGPTTDHEDEEDRWEGPLPAYMSGIEDNSPEAVERRRLHTERQQSEAIRTVQAREMRERLSREHKMSRELFGRLRLQYGQMFIDSINAGIAAVWDEVKPVFSANSKDGKAGQPRLMPQLEMRGNTVYFHGFNLNGTTKSITTPVSTTDTLLGARPIWKYKEWVEYAVPRIIAIIDEYAEKAHLVRVGLASASGRVE
ncbi:hypothetical protein [uncultured Massilia sp.]|uniref:hypothetical protein n=1 Tax=uncultured Massilia sp. TaxID=169973 RepID=UPI0025D00282|nr:hypothetical protein [uncultured Massilia sp.]